MASSEKPLVDVLQMAVDEINDAGGIHGQKLEMIVADCRSDAEFCATEAERLVSSEHVAALFGCWTSSCRKAVKKVVENHHHLLFYPVQYEGLESSPDIIYTGSTPNQQIIPMSLWALQNKGKRFYLIGSDYIYPRRANLIVKEILQMQGGVLLAERYLPLGSQDFDVMINEILLLQPDFIVNTINGESNLYFFRALKNKNIKASNIPVFSTSISESQLVSMNINDNHQQTNLAEGHYSAWNYFQSLDNPENKIFIDKFKKKYGDNRVVDAPMEATYIAIKLWCSVVKENNIFDLKLIKNQISRESMMSPSGIVAMDFDTRHLWRKVFIGQIKSNGQFHIVWQSSKEIRPAPFPFYRKKSEWLKLEHEFAEKSP